MIQYYLEENNIAVQIYAKIRVHHMLLLSPSTLVNIPCLYPGILTTFLSFYVKTFDSDMAPVGMYRKNEGKHLFFL